MTNNAMNRNSGIECNENYDAEIIDAYIRPVIEYEFHAEIEVLIHNPHGENVRALKSYAARPENHQIINDPGIDEDRVQESVTYQWSESNHDDCTERLPYREDDWEPNSDLDNDEALFQECIKVATKNPESEIELLFRNLDEFEREKIRPSVHKRETSGFDSGPERDRYVTDIVSLKDNQAYFLCPRCGTSHAFPDELSVVPISCLNEDCGAEISMRIEWELAAGDTADEAEAKLDSNDASAKIECDHEFDTVARAARGSRTHGLECVDCGLLRVFPYH